MPELRHLSHSSVSTYASCSRLWQARYVEGMRGATTPPLLIGSVVDAVFERYLRAKVAGEATPALSDLWQATWLKHTTGEREASIDWQGELPEKLENDGRRLIMFSGTLDLLNSLNPLVDPNGEPFLQRYVELRIPGVPIPTIGYLDYIGEDLIPGDFKTSSSRWAEGRARKELQPRIYLAALLQAGFPLPRLAFRHWVWTKTKIPVIQEIETEFTPAEIYHALEVVSKAWRGIQAGVFVPNSGYTYCNDSCPVWASCVGMR